MNHYLRTLALVLPSLLLTDSISGQELVATGIMATGTMSRAKIGGDDFYLGDMIQVQVLQPANTGKLYVSAHLEFSKTGDENDYRPLATSNDALGQAYKSTAYDGVRDYVMFLNANQNTTRHVSLFIPYRAAQITSGHSFHRRYAIRLWDNRNNNFKSLFLTPEYVNAETDESGTVVITTVTARACAAPVGGAPPVPIAESVDKGRLQFFDARTGGWICPATN